MPIDKQPIDNNLASKESPPDLDLKAARLASGLFAADLPLVLLLYPVLVAPSVLASILGGVSEQLSPSFFGATFLGAERIFGLLFTLVIALRWRGKLGFQKSLVKFSSIFSYFFFGIGVWLAWIVPSATMSIGAEPSGVPIGNLILLICAAAISIRYYFYFFSFSFGSCTFGEGLTSAASFIKKEWLLPVKATIAPLSVMLLATGFASAPYPDGRYWQLVAFAEGLGGIYWVLSTYLGLAYGLLLMDGKTWHELKLDPYREPRFESISKEAKPFVSKLFLPRSGVTLLVLSILVWFGNMIRVTTMPPPVSIEVNEATVSENKVLLKLKIEDDKFKFHGIYPKLFSLAGETGTRIAGLPEKVSIDGFTEADTPLSLQGLKSPVGLSLEFSTDRSGRALTELKDLFLWYRGVRIKALSLKEKEPK